MAEWSRALATTIRDYVKGYEPNLMRNQKLLALLEKKGRIEFNMSGTSREWKVQYDRAVISGNLGNTALSFEPTNRFQIANLDYRGMACTDSLSKRDFLMNRGKEAIIKYYDKMIKLLMEDMERKMGTEPWNRDGNATGSTELIHGLPSFLAASANSLTIDTVTPRSTNQADIVQVPGDTYAGLTTGLGDYGGSWTGAWPNSGDGDDAYDFNSPVLINYNSTAFGGAGNVWATNATNAMRYIITALQKDSSKRGELDAIFLDRDLYRKFKNQNDQYQKIEISSDQSLRALGFKDVINLDGVEVTSDFGMPAGIGYALNVDQLVLGSMQDRLFSTEGPTYDMQTRAYRTVVDFLGNLFVESSCKYFGKLAAY